MAIVFMLNFFVGKRANEKVAAMWLTEAVPILKNNFAHLGFGEDQNLSLSQITYDEFEYYASGRNNMGYLFINMRTKKRQDVISSGLLGMIWPHHDRIIMDIPIEADLPIEFVMCREYAVKQNITEMPHLKGLVQSYKPVDFKDTGYGFLAESPEIITSIFTKKLVNLFIKYEKYLEFLHITDQKVYTNNPLVLKAEFFLGDSGNEYEHSAKLLEAILELVDHIAMNAAFPTKVIEKARQKRLEQKKAENKEKENEEREKIQEDKDNKLREKLSTMTPVQKKNYLEKLEKKEKKRELRGRNKVMKF